MQFRIYAREPARRKYRAFATVKFATANVRARNSDARRKRYFTPMEIRIYGGTDAECEDEELQECYYRHELPKAGCVFQPVGNVPLRFAARGGCFLLFKPVPIFCVEMRREISSRGADIMPANVKPDTPCIRR